MRSLVTPIPTVTSASSGPYFRPERGLTLVKGMAMTTAQTDAHGNEGAASTEYAILAVAVAAAVLVVVGALATDVLGLFDCTRVSIETETSSC